MKTEIANVSDVERRVTVELDAEQVGNSIDKAYKNLQKKARLPGFRPGKAPLSILQKHFKAQVEEEVISELVQKSFPEVMEQQDLTPVSRPKVENGVLEKGKTFSYTVAIEVKPTIDIKDFTGLKIERPQPEATDEDINAELERSRASYADMQERNDRATQAGDHITFDLEGLIGEEPYMGGKKTDYFLELGKDMLLPGFDENMIGLNLGDTKEFSLEIAADYGDAQVAGKTIAFKVDLKTIKEKVLPELSDDFAKDVGEYENLEQLKDAARTSINQRKRQETEARVRDQIFDALIEKNPFTVPQGMVEMQAQNMLQEVTRMFQQQGMDISEMGQSQEQMLANYKEPAEKRVRSGLLLEAVATKENIKAEDDDYEKQYEELAGMYNEKIETIKANINKDQIESQIMERKTIDFILSSAEITET